MPPSARGVGLYAPGKSGEQFYLAAYTFAPLPILSAPARLPAGWLAAAYGPAASGAAGIAGLAGLTVVRNLPGGALLARAEPTPPPPIP